MGIFFFSPEMIRKIFSANSKLFEELGFETLNGLLMHPNCHGPAGPLDFRGKRNFIP
jgi:hypothetical protein